jgi:hypothetical protein
VVKNGQFRETGNNGHTTQNEDKHNKKHNTENLKMSNSEPPTIRGSSQV